MKRFTSGFVLQARWRGLWYNIAPLRHVRNSGIRLVVAPSRRLYSEAALTTETQEEKKTTETAGSKKSSSKKKSKKELKKERTWLIPAPIQLTARFSDTEDAPKEKALKILRKLSTMRGNQERFQIYQRLSLVLLVTPRYASWLKDKEFLAEALKELTAPLIKPGVTDRSKVLLVGGCIDGLAPSVQHPKPSGIPVHEGFTILFGPRTVVLANWEDLPDKLRGSAPREASSLTWLTNVDDARNASITVPLANTLFKTGQRSMLSLSRWSIKKDKVVQDEPETELRNVRVRSFDPSLKTPIKVNTSIRAIPITPPRPIVNGLGNIVRTVDFGPEGEQPASTELESAVAEYLESIKADRADIWALVIPKALAESQALITDKEVVREKWVGQPDDSYVGSLIYQGARFCRVLSGGGGWGPKQGLLSLDPETVYDSQTEARFDTSEGTPQEQEDALGSLAHEGSSIQFFASRPLFDTLMPKPYLHRNNFLRTTLFGSMDSTIDDVGSTGDRHFTLRPKFGSMVDYGLFGCVSQGGLFIGYSQQEKDNAVSRVDDPVVSSNSVLEKSDQSEQPKPSPKENFYTSKIDFPNSFFQKDFFPREPLPTTKVNPNPTPESLRIRRIGFIPTRTVRKVDTDRPPGWNASVRRIPTSGAIATEDETPPIPSSKSEKASAGGLIRRVSGFGIHKLSERGTTGSGDSEAHEH